MNTEQLRRRYLPTNVRLLIVGESPPAGGTFFYAGNSNLFHYTKKSFEQALQRTWDTHEHFLYFFCEQGFFLDDLCLIPVNKLLKQDRQKYLQAGIKPLSNRIRTYMPNTVLVTPKAIMRHVAKAFKMADSYAYTESLPFPANSWQNVYVGAFDAFLRGHYA